MAVNKSPLQAALWMSGALVSFLCMGISGRALGEALSPAEIAFYRNVTCLVLLVPFVVHSGIMRTVVTHKLGLHVIRNSVHFAAQWSWFFGLTLLPLAEVFALEFTAPIWTAILASLFLRERFNAVRIGAIALGFVGILIILRPGLAIIDPGSFVVLGAALGYAVSYVFTKKLVATESPLTILIYMNLVQLPIGLALSWRTFTWLSTDHYPWILLLGVVGLTSHYCISRALQCADAMVVVPLDFLRLPLAAVTAWLLYAEAIDPFVLIGALFVLAGNWLNLKA